MKLHAFAVDGGSPRPETPVPFGGKMYFAATEGDSSQLWVTDGTVAGTVAVTSDPTRTEIHYVTPMADKLYFSGCATQSGGPCGQFQAGIDGALYASDGTEGSTSLVADFHPWSPPPFRLTTSGSRLFFNADVSPGLGAFAYTAAGGVMQLAYNWESPGDYADEFNFHFVPFRNGSSLFYARTAGAGDFGTLWFSDGTPAGTVTLLPQGANPQGANPLGRIVVAGATAYFGAPCMPGGENCDFVASTGLWKTDGTVAGTSLSEHLPSTPYELAVVGPTIYFSAMTTNPCPPDAGPEMQGGCDLELWTSDGTAGNASVVIDLNSGTASSTPQQLTAFGDKLLFSADDGTGRKWFLTDGTAAGTFALSTATPGQCTPFVAGATIFFCAVDAAGEEPWTSDGTPAGTARWADLNPGPAGSMPDGFALYGGKVLFSAFEGTTPALYIADLDGSAPDGGSDADSGDAGAGEAGAADDAGPLVDAAKPDTSAPDGGGSVADTGADGVAEDATTNSDGDATGQGGDSGDSDAAGGSGGGPDDGGCTMTGRSSPSWLTPLVTLFFLALRRRMRSSS